MPRVDGDAAWSGTSVACTWDSPREGVEWVHAWLKSGLSTVAKEGLLTLAAVAGVLTLITGCVVGPDYVRPPVITPDAYKEVDGWKVAQPKDDVIRGAWWEIFGDPQLNALEPQVNISNQNLVVAEATYRQARAGARGQSQLLSYGEARSQLYTLP